MNLQNPYLAPILLLVMSAGTLGGAYAFQYWGGLQPCALCLYQRWPWWIAGALAIVAIVAVRDRRLHAAALSLATLAVWVGAGIAVYHVGVEQRWWEGPSACSGAATPATLEELRAMVLAAPVVRCDDVAWSLFGISMAGYNALLSLATGGGVVWLLRNERRRQ
ncbi:MAG: disulfide bond formation protein B [Alphaproteobacteria bacterium]